VVSFGEGCGEPAVLLTEVAEDAVEDPHAERVTTASMAAAIRADIL
jgi:hypothetical protein